MICKHLLSDERGSLGTEYVVLLSLVAVGSVGAFVALGVPLLNLFHAQQLFLVMPVP